MGEGGSQNWGAERAGTSVLLHLRVWSSPSTQGTCISLQAGGAALLLTQDQGMSQSSRQLNA